MTTDARRAVSDARSTVDAPVGAGWGAWPPPTPGDRPLSMTSRADGAEHAVMATELEHSNRTGQQPMGMCGVVVDMAPLGATARHVCRPCREAVSRRRQDARPGARVPTPPWALLVQWYEALVRLLRGGLHPDAPKALGPGARAPLALPAPPSRPAAASRPAAPAEHPVPAPRPRTSPALAQPSVGGRHRRD